MNLARQVRLADLTTLRVGGPVAHYIEAGTPEQLVSVVRAADEAGEAVLVLGGGSNLLASDDGFPGTVVRVRVRGARFAAVDDAVDVTAAAGEDWDGLVLRCITEGLSGVECLAGIPGLAGATPIQNVSAYGQEVADTITSVRAFDRLGGRIVELTAGQCGFGYRTSMFKVQAAAGHGSGCGAAATGRFVVLSVTFRLRRDQLSGPIRYGELARALGVAEGCRVPLADARAAVLGLRRRKGMVLDDADPDTCSAGSFFTNPVLSAGEFADLVHLVAARSAESSEVEIPHWPVADGQVKVSAAWLIERAGFGKGFAGSNPAGARISTKHTLALTNPGSATAASLIGLARQIRDGVRKEFGVELVNEPVLIGMQL